LDYKVKNDFPQFYLEDEDTLKLLETIQEGQNLIYNEITDLTTCVDYEKCDEKYLDYLVAETGFTPNIPLNTYRKRKIAKNGRKYLAMRGTDEGIIFCIKDLFDIDIIIENHFEDSFQIGFSMIGGNDYISSIDEEFKNIIKHHETNPDLIYCITQIVEYLKWDPTLYQLIYEET